MATATMYIYSGLTRAHILHMASSTLLHPEDACELTHGIRDSILSMSSSMIHGTGYGNELTPLAPRLMGSMSPVLLSWYMKPLR